MCPYRAKRSLIRNRVDPNTKVRYKCNTLSECTGPSSVCGWNHYVPCDSHNGWEQDFRLN